ncbi:hypothetical protein [Longimicrobium sp.]|jgi:hypothetical protein|uniref:hypothetical protein n=1 Tax=Longimicrobium sp. TaxID=2029185 RepID=UPI002EDBA171
MRRTRLHGLLMRREALYGIDSGPTPLAHGVQLEESPWNTLEVDYLERNERDQAAGSGLGSTSGAQPSGRWAKFRAVIALKGAAAAADVPEIDVAFAACGLVRTDDATPGAEKRTWAPIAAGQEGESVTAYAYAGGLLYRIVGVRGKITNVQLTAAQICRVTMEFNGLLAGDPEDAVLPAITYAQRALKPPVAGGGALSLNGYGPRWHSFAFDMGTELVALARGNAPGGHAGYGIVDYKPVVKAQIDVPPVLAAFNPWALERTAEVFPWSIALPGAQYNSWVIAGPAGQMAKAPPGERDKLAMVDVQIRVCGDDTDPAAAPFRLVQS